MTKHIANWKLIKQIAIEWMSKNKNKAISLEDLEKLFIAKHPERNPVNVSLDTRMLTVNSNSRLSYLYIFGCPSSGKKIRNPHLENNKEAEYPRKSSEKNEKDFFFHIETEDSSLFERYNSAKHGEWEMKLDSNNINKLKKIE
ncbi:hypothetical protein GLP24_12285 [Photobacterium carnosum]|uniref:hypothetical protein n=1 Tax=Photobacterium carnosum TaxID=2023717 RepID=UPI001E542E2B|nr:hypothetical protein [Photobacterium carnosum]MCD9545627.1 hypothetical protein [Photobacterium carnosum]